MYEMSVEHESQFMIEEKVFGIFPSNLYDAL